MHQLLRSRFRKEIVPAQPNAWAPSYCVGASRTDPDAKQHVAYIAGLILVGVYMRFGGGVVFAPFGHLSEDWDKVLAFFGKSILAAIWGT